MAAGCGGQDIKDPYGINLRSDPSPWCGARAAGPRWRSRRLPPAGLLKRSMALTTGVCLALSGGPQQLGHSTDHSDARLPDTIGNHPQHRCGLSDEPRCLNNTRRCFCNFLGPNHCLARERRWSSFSRVTLAFQQYFMNHATESRHTLSVLSSKAPVGTATNWVSGQDRASKPRQDDS